MKRYPNLGALLAVTAILVVVMTTAVSAHQGRWLGSQRFVQVWIGSTGDDTFVAQPGDRDRVVGRSGDDVLDAGDRFDVVRGSLGDDTITGGDGPDRLIGGPGNDTISGDDTLAGGEGRDIIRAGRGDDTVLAQDGRRDWIRCGPGEDSYAADAWDLVADDCETPIGTNAAVLP